MQLEVLKPKDDYGAANHVEICCNYSRRLLEIRARTDAKSAAIVKDELVGILDERETTMEFKKALGR